tara:strand:- start:29 stop:475 length:447 start_codon:yes stop_codon:yes gene_type:complete
MTSNDIKTIEYLDPDIEANLYKLNNNSKYGLYFYYYHTNLTLDDFQVNDEFKFICKRTFKLYEGGKVLKKTTKKIYYSINDKQHSKIKFKDHYVFRKGKPLYKKPKKFENYKKSNSKYKSKKQKELDKFKYLLNGLSNNTIVKVNKID